MRDTKKYPDDMVENLGESPGMCSDSPGSAPIEIPKRETFSLRGSKKERKEILGSGWEKRRSHVCFHPRGLGPTRGRSAAPPRTVREARGRSGAPARTVRYCFQNDRCRTSSPRAMRMVRAALADSPPGASRRSGPLPRTVRPPLLNLA
jgi:hypothetical protein